MKLVSEKFTEATRIKPETYKAFLLWVDEMLLTSRHLMSSKRLAEEIQFFNELQSNIEANKYHSEVMLRNVIAFRLGQFTAAYMEQEGIGPEDVDDLLSIVDQITEEMQ